MNINRAISYGYAVQSFANATYGFLAVVLAEFFFNGNDNNFIKSLNAYGSYAAGYFFMPIGALLIGRYGDKYGRRMMILLGTFFSSILVFITGTLPGYSSIGIIAPILFVSIRLCQGVCTSAEYSVFVYNYEKSVEKKRVGESNAWILCCGMIGTCFAAIAGYLTRYMLEGGWRLPFIIAGIAMMIVFIIRLNIQETLDFREAKIKGIFTKTPYRDLLKFYKMGMFPSIFLSTYGLMSYCMSLIYANKLFQECGLSVQDSMLYCIPIIVYFALNIYVMGKFSNVIGVRIQVISGLILMLLISPGIFYIASINSVVTTYLYAVCFITVSTITTSCSNVLIASYFPINCRFSGMSISDAFGAAIGGGSLFCALWLSKYFGTKLAIVILIYAIIIPSLIGILLNKRKIVI